MKLFKRLEDLFVAITFAEADDAETARQILKEEERSRTEDLRQMPEEGKKDTTLTVHPIKP